MTYEVCSPKIHEAAEKTGNYDEADHLAQVLSYIGHSKWMQKKARRVCYRS